MEGRLCTGVGRCGGAALLGGGEGLEEGEDVHCEGLVWVGWLGVVCCWGVFGWMWGLLGW